jgi:hypothetical protein
MGRIDELIAFVEGLKEETLSNLVQELKYKPREFSVYLARSKEDWLRRFSDHGDDIFNHLHPQKQGMLLIINSRKS